MKALTLGAILVLCAVLVSGIACAQGPGSGMGPGMMGVYGFGYGMGPGMMGGHGPGYPGVLGIPSEACNKLLSETSGFRKELHLKRFEYNEAIRDPGTSAESLGRLVKDIYDLQAKIQAKNVGGCWWN